MFTNLRSSFRAVLVPAAVIAFAACDDDPTGPDLTDDIVGIASSTSSVSTLVTALEAAGLVDALQGDGPFTVFAPVNAAFADLGSDVVAGLLDTGNLDLLTRVLTFHVVPGTAAFSDDLTDGQTVTTLEGGTLEIGVSGSGVTVNGVSVTSADIEATNGVIHLIDEVLIPSDTDVYETAVLTAGTTTLASAVLAANLDDDLQGAGPFTVFAPTNAAFAAVDAYTLGALLAAGNKDILERVLGFHVIAGQKIMAADLTDGAMVPTLEGGMLTVDLSNATDPKVNGVSITATDIEVSNGVIHLVDEVILPEFNIVETAILTEGFSTLVAAVGAADLGAALSDEAASLTVFAPTNAAFEALGGTVDLLLEAGNQSILSDVLLYHVLGSAVASTALADGLTQATLETGDVTFNADAGSPSGFKINDANITAVDIQTSNGVIHVIDAVLTQGLDVVQRATVTPETQTLTAAVVAASTNGSEDLATLLSGTAGAPFTVFAPVEAAFEALGTDKLDVVLDPANAELLADILRYHVVAGAKVMAADLAGLGGSATTYDGADVTFDLSGATPKVNGANIVATDIEVSNGVIHLIDGVLTETLDIPQVATLNGFSTLVQLVTTAGLADDLSSPNGAFTVFAPTNAAFAALAAVPQGQDLIDVLTYHVLDTQVASTDLSDGLVVDNTLNGASFTVNIDAGTGAVTLTDGTGNTVGVVLTDVAAENGVIHVIDEVLLPGN
jgi:uncharacterized surface protein with fasciclin (FAS1) repeats